MTDEVNNSPTPKQVDVLEALLFVEKAIATQGAYQEAMIIKAARQHIEELRSKLEAIKAAQTPEPAAEAAE